MLGLNKVRVLVVDDAVVVRRMVTEVLGSDPGIEVVGAASNGKIALARLPQYNPDVVTLDVEMPELDGLGTLREIRKTHPRLPVIMFSTLTMRGAAAALDALAAGASDYVTKPANVGSVGAAREAIRSELIPKIKALCGRGPALGRARPTAPPPAKPTGGLSDLAPRPAGGLSGLVPPPRVAGGLSGIVNLPRPAGGSAADRITAPVEVVVVGVSTGGPNALADLLPALPADFPAPVLIVQHMPPVFTRLLAERLDAKCKLRVREAADGDRPAPGGVWVAPGGRHLEVVRDPLGLRLRLTDAPPENSCRPAADVLFRSAAATGPGVLAAVLTGMGQDGLRGCEAVRAGGGQVVAQDEETSVVWGMPGFVTRAGLPDRVLPLDQIATELVRRARRGRAVGATR